MNGYHLGSTLSIVLILTTALQARLDKYLYFIDKKVERYNNSPPQVTASTGGTGIWTDLKVDVLILNCASDVPVAHQQQKNKKGCFSGNLGLVNLQ